MAPMRAALASMALGLLLLLSGCGSGPKEPFKIVSGSENTVLEPIVSEFCRSRGVTCTFTYEGSLDIGLALGSAEGIDADAVWPASSVWIDLFDTGRKVKDTVSIAQMPVILGVRRSKAEALGWVGRPVTMADVLGAVKSGQLKFLMTSATQSNSGASAYLAMLTTALGGADRMMTADDLSRQDVRQTVGDLLGGVERSAGSSGWLADLYVKSAAEGTQYDAMWNYEALIKETNDKLRAAGNEALYAIYPADGIAVADSPLGFVSRGKGDATEAFFKDLVTFLQSEPVAKRIAATGRRIPLGNVTAAAQADSNLDPSRLLTAIRLPEPTVIRQALDLYQSALRKPSLTALCLITPAPWPVKVRSSWRPRSISCLRRTGQRRYWCSGRRMTRSWSIPSKAGCASGWWLAVNRWRSRHCSKKRAATALMAAPTCMAALCGRSRISSRRPGARPTCPPSC